KSISGGLLPAVILGGDNQAEIDVLSLDLVANCQRADDWNCPTDIPDVAAVDIQALFEKVDREFNIEDGVEFEGDGGFGGESGFMEDFEGDPFDLPADAVMEAVEIFVYYESDSVEIPMEFDLQIHEIATKMAEFPDTKALIEGYADDGGIHSYNNELSVGRATGIKRCLEQYFAIDPERIEIIGFGKDRPISVEADQKSNNRRAVIILE
ncbi:MAG: OmpA family protein, partial [Pseudomonadales bacterium]|nr:OmpA family protein [Pseudomonadales bacterium]